MSKTKTITKYYKAIIKISAESSSSDEADIEEDIEEAASNYADWLNDAIIDDNYWGSGEFDVELISWDETKMVKEKK